jgi:hypothetical protein
MILTLWREHLGFRHYIPLKTAKFGAKSFELRESTYGYLWDFMVHTGPGSDIVTNIYVPSSLKSSRIVVEIYGT